MFVNLSKYEVGQNGTMRNKMSMGLRVMEIVNGRNNVTSTQR